MTGQELFHALSFVDERYIAEAETAKLGRNAPWMKAISVAACLCILLTGLYAYRLLQPKGASEADAAPAAPEAAQAEGTPEEAQIRGESSAEISEDVYLPAVQVIGVTVQDHGREYTLEATEGMALLDILQNQDYDPDQVCRCDAEFTVTTEFGERYDINLQEGFARCQQGQASLSEDHLQQIQSVLEKE